MLHSDILSLEVEILAAKPLLFFQILQFSLLLTFVGGYRSIFTVASQVEVSVTRGKVYDADSWLDDRTLVHFSVWGMSKG